jgi:trimeric autotransporter adhesin
MPRHRQSALRTDLKVARFEKRKKGISTVIGSLIFVLILITGLTTIATVFSYYNNYNSQLLQSDQSVLQRQETSLSVTGLAYGASANTIATSTSAALAYVAITLTNSQTSASPSTFQEKVTFNPSTYSSYEASNLGNIRFCLDAFCFKPLFAWLESCTPSCITTATSASAWVKLTSAIAASGGTLVIYMVFQTTSTTFDDNYWGEAPTLSGTYGQYDNGANVFTFYDNFAGTTLNSAKWTIINSSADITVNNGLTVSLSKSTGYGFIASATQTNPLVAETYTSSGNSILGVATSQSINGFIALYSGYSLDWAGGDDYVTYQPSGTTTNLKTTAQSTFPAGIWQVTWSATAVQYFSDGAGNTYSGTHSGVAITSYGIYLGESNGVLSSSTFTWARMRAYPPKNVMPTTSFAALVLTGTATSYSFQNKLVYSQGLWWAFYSDGTNIDYVTSPDGSVWSSPTIVSSSSDSTKGYDFSMWTSGSTIYYVLTASGKSASFLWRYGTLQSSGTISWTISQTSQSTTNTVYSYDSMATDSSGNIWVALNTNDGTNTHIEVWRYSASTWTKVDDISPLSSDETAMLTPLSTGIALIYGEGSVTAVVKIITSATGSSWSKAVSPPSDYLLFSSSADSITNTVYFVGLASGSAGVTTGTINFWTFTSGASATSSETQLQSTSSSWSVSISEMPSKTLVVFYGSGADVYMLSSLNFGTTWSSVQTISTSESRVTGVATAIGGGAAIWTSGTSSPFNVRFAAVPVLTVVNSSPFAVNMISLYILDTVSNSLIHFDTNSSASGVSGSFNDHIGAGETMSIPLTTFTWTIDQNYIITVASDQGLIFSLTLTSPS